MTGRWRTAALAAVALLVAAACGSGSPSQTVAGARASEAAGGLPLGSPVSVSSPSPGTKPAGAWFAARVEQPPEIEAQPTNAPAFCSPCHPIVGTYIAVLVATPSGFMALGRQLPPSRAAVWTASADATEWTRDATLPAPDGSGIAAAVATGDTVLAVGTSGGAAAVWHRAAAAAADAGAWRLTALPSPPMGQTEQLTAVARIDGGYVAAGYAQDVLGVKRATFWRSADGELWSRADSGSASGSTATEVTGLAASGKEIVAVGIAGDERRGAGAVWRSDDAGQTWATVSSPSLSAGRMLAVAATPGGFAATGENVDQTAAAAWFSTDGSTWTVAGGSGLENGGAQMVMVAVAAKRAGGLVADGWKSDAGNGSAVVWDSGDGRSWSRRPQDPTFSGAGMAAILATPRLLAAGSMGWPDTHSAQVWVPSGN